MKHTTTSVTSLSLLALASAATLTSDAFAGAPAKPAVAKDSGSLLAGSFLDKVTGTVDVGYDSGYYFRGLWFSNNNVWEGLTLSLPVSDQLSLSLGAVYTSSTNTNIRANGLKTGLKYSELDLIAGATYDAGFAKFGLVYTYYNFYDTFSGSVTNATTGYAAGTSFRNGDRDSAITTSSDLGLTISKSIGPVNLNAGYWYDFRIGGSYLESSADCPIEVTSHFSVVPSVSVGYGLNYYSFAGNTAVGGVGGPGKKDGFTAVRPALSFPVKITNTATFTPYAAMNLSGSARYSPAATGTAANNEEGRNDFYFGGKMSVSF
jgi:hypothetical protein